MRPLWQAGLLLAGLAIIPAAAQRPVRPTTQVSGTLSFDARATLGRFTGTTATLTGAITGGPGLEAVRGWVAFPADSLRTGNRLRDRDMRASLETARFPIIRFALTAVRPSTPQGDTVVVTLAGDFTIHGVTRAVELPATLTWGPDALRLQALLTLDVRDYQVGKLTKAFGTIRMEPEIVVRIDLRFTQDAR